VRGAAVPVQLNHIIIPSHDKMASAMFLAELLGLDPPRAVSHFVAVTVSNGVTLDYDDVDDFRPQHCAFLVSDEEFDAIFERVRAAGLDFFADPSHKYPEVVNNRNGGRGFYFSDPDGHNMEVFTKIPL
jgi:catechol 2,3-dioxygenase-like lactoylglutathione lyase family enzyme